MTEKEDNANNTRLFPTTTSQTSRTANSTVSQSALIRTQSQIPRLRMHLPVF
jgi:hypothetical protein